mmetsp:Transcript_55019/g.130009  ORF Transcript_55019/g.130009 Transcript_55019/m.130009 type:complete len:159 (+) Transcript_55019:29-505(+)
MIRVTKAVWVQLPRLGRVGPARRIPDNQLVIESASLSSKLWFAIATNHRERDVCEICRHCQHVPAIVCLPWSPSWLRRSFAKHAPEESRAGRLLSFLLKEGATGKEGNLFNGRVQRQPAREHRFVCRIRARRHADRVYLPRQPEPTRLVPQDKLQHFP